MMHHVSHCLRVGYDCFLSRIEFWGFTLLDETY
jgi:hypothetical protein